MHGVTRAASMGVLVSLALGGCAEPAGPGHPRRGSLAVPQQARHHGAGGLIRSIEPAPVGPDGLVAGRPTDFVINLDVPLDPSVSGFTLLAGRSIRVTLPDEFVSDGRPLQQFPCPVVTACNSAALLQGWPQNPVPFPQYALAYEGGNAIVITARQALVPVGAQNPGIKQIHLILLGFTNPAPGTYAVRVEAEIGPGGAGRSAAARRGPGAD